MSDAETGGEDDGNAARSADFVEALARGLRVLESFTLPESESQRGRMTLTDVGRLTGLTRGTARRLLLTLKDMHYVDSDGKLFWLTPRVLRLAEGFRMPIGLGDRAAALLHELTRSINESASVAVLEGESIVYIERVEVRRIYSSRIVNGTRLPASCSSIGRMLLASQSQEQLDIWLDRYPLPKLTEHTITDRAAFQAEVERIRALGYAIIDEELEIGIRSIAVPIVSRAGRVVAALNASTSTARHRTQDLREVFLPELRRTAAALAENMDW
ncbi:MAG: IclR family transcriptional regulator [Paracoccus denitrificans]|uniref:IclR family transcriptional regulator n=1 Tax=Paracoccus denitrificans TaxID=266 RepID=A0A533I615_PARDE|nr:MAG: IclR family transcriptional regulator [Paracoccus denitrificans]